MNPLAQAPPSFWQTTQHIDTVLAKAGSARKPITPQLKQVAEIDTDAIKRVANDVWGTDARDKTLSSSISASLETLEHATSQALKAWNGKAATTFEQYLFNVRKWLGDAKPHVDAVAKALTELADKLEVTLAKVMTMVAAGSGALSGLVGILSAATSAAAGSEDPILSKAVALAFAVLTGLIAIASFCVSLVTAQNEKVAKIRSAMTTMERFEKAV